MAVWAVDVYRGVGEIGGGVDRHARRTLHDVLDNLVFCLATQEPAADKMSILDRRRVGSVQLQVLDLQPPKELAFLPRSVDG
jgi:hypothetical protein